MKEEKNMKLCWERQEPVRKGVTETINWTTPNDDIVGQRYFGRPTEGVFTAESCFGYGGRINGEHLGTEEAYELFTTLERKLNSDGIGGFLMYTR